MGTRSALPLAATYLQYVSLGHRPSALHLDLFEQPGENGFLSDLRINADFGLRIAKVT
jgi:hypothetical protein